MSAWTDFRDHHPVGRALAVGFCLMVCIILLITGCSVIGNRPPPYDWPKLMVHRHVVPHSEMRVACSQYVPWHSAAESCAVIYFDLKECHIYLSLDFPSLAVAEHEEKHCKGWDHLGDTTLLDAWEWYKK